MPLTRSVQVASICAIVLSLGSVSASAIPTDARISYSGLGAIKLGMTERQIERAAKRPITLSSTRGSECALAMLAPKTQGLFTERRLRRIYVQTPRFATKKGIRVGATEKRVLAAYPDMLARVPQKFANEDNLVLSKDDRKIVFSLADGKISEISTGRTPEINLVERCS